MAVTLRPPVPVDPVPPPGPILSLVDSSPFGDTGDGDDWTGGFAYEPENHGAGEIRDPCDHSSMDLPALPTPTGLVTAPSNNGGTLTNAASPYDYQVSAVDANGETLACAPVAATIAAGTTGSVKLTWNTVEFATSYKVYGRKTGSIGLLAQGIVPVDDVAPTVSWTDTGAATPGAVVPASNTTGGPGQYSPPGIVVFYPFIVSAEDACSTFGFNRHDFKGRATRLVNLAAKAQIEKEFWAGAYAQTGYPNNFLGNSADPNYVDLTPGGGPPTVARGQQILEDYLQQCGFGGQGMIHTQAQTAPNLLSARLVDGPRPGTQQLLSVLGNIIVPGSGYPGTGAMGAVPAAGTAYMYATDLVTVRLDNDDNVRVFPDSFAEALDRAENLIRFRAEKYAAASWDGICHAAVRVTLPT